MASNSTTQLCYLCHTSLGDGSPTTTFSKCQHEFHYDCLQMRLMEKDRKCPQCADAASEGSMATPQSSRRAEKTMEPMRMVEIPASSSPPPTAREVPYEYQRSVLSPHRPVVQQSYRAEESPLPMHRGTSTVHRISEPEPRSSLPTWDCRLCTFKNKGEDEQCPMCGEGKRPHEIARLISDGHSHAEPVREVRSIPKENPRRPITPNQSMDWQSTSTEELIVFIPELPSCGLTSRLEETIESRLNDTHRIATTNVRCYPDIGLGVVKLANKKDQDHLVQALQSIVLDPKTSTTVRFVDELLLDFYLVLDPTKKSDISSHDIAERWRVLSNTPQRPQCELVSDQFPNVFSLTFRSLEELIAVQSIDVFAIQGHPVHVYLRADCSFLEDLPTHLTLSDLRVAISAQIGHPCDEASLYIQYNPKTSCALVLTTYKAGQWSRITFNDQSCAKRSRLSYRLACCPYPRTLSLDDLTKHNLFGNAVVQSYRLADRVMLEITDRSTYESALQRGMISVKGQPVHITPFTDVLNNPETIEINAQNWYETAMLTHEPDLKQFIDSSSKEIFQYQWNAQEWIDQLQTCDGLKDKESDKKRRLLRVTVMINTIGVLTRQAYRTETEVKLICPRAQSVIYNHRSKLTKSQELTTPLRPPFPSTKVFVVNEDCLAVYQRMAAKNCSPVLLNMANAETPGGGYRRGAGAQEENLFRRSNYYLSLDAELDTKKEADRFWCTETGDKKPVDLGQNFYPIGDFGAIYSSDLTVFRHSEDKGYAFLDKPLSGVCAIAVAAYDQRENRAADDQLLNEKQAVGTRKKIENLFAVAHHHGHDCLILSAFGCGAFRNPPLHIAAIFQSVIEQYAGYFKEIYFSIIDDQNTGKRSNPNGNFQPFQSILNGFIASPRTRELEANMFSGPFRILAKTQGKTSVDQVKIFDRWPCWYGALCHDLNNPRHGQTYSHSGLCPEYETCTRFNPADHSVHASSFIHRTPCPHGGQCRNIRDSAHQRKFYHPEFCSARGNCRDMNKAHLTKYSHLPLCRDGIQCPLHIKNDSEHDASYRHCQPECSHADHCAYFHDPNHIAGQGHPFPTPCPLTPYSCRAHHGYLQAKRDPSAKLSRTMEEHCHRYAHVCPWGRLCTDTSPDHRRLSIHIARSLCAEKDPCSKLNAEEHMNSFSHPTKPDIRYLCRYAGPDCRDRRRADHIARFRHTANYKHIGVAHYSGLNKKVNFVRNHKTMIENVESYARTEKWGSPKQTIEEVIDWIRALPPVHRCEKTIFESILVHGHVMSRTYMDRLRKSVFVANAVGQHPRVREILEHHNNSVLTKQAQEFIQALVSLEFTKNYAAIAAMGAPQPLIDDNEKDKKDVTRTEAQLKSSLKPQEIVDIREHAKRIAYASLKLHENKTGIGHAQDTSLGTDNHIFSIMGPHLGYYYGDIFVVFKREIMRHPDANFSIQAATSFGRSQSAYQKQPWLKDPGTPAERIQQFHRTKLHCSIPDWEEAAAMELMALTGLEKKSMHVKLEAVQKRWMLIDSHDTFEAHLPQLIPLDYIDHVYMAKNLFDSMSQAYRDVAQKTFGNRLTLTDHVVDLNAPKQLDATHVPYQAHVLQEIVKTIATTTARPQYGTTITMPASNFKEYITIPMTISQSFHQQHAKKDADETVFIYWKAIGGDMMLALSKEEITADKDQSANRCLLCYIAETPTVDTSDDYREPYSYLTANFPYSHEMLTRKLDFKAKSNTFHRGCNVDDYIIYCLIVKRKTGQVILSHVGSNNIYNHQTIEYNFDRSELDLSTLDYVQISARERTVPVRDLVIRHEPIKEYHVTFDKEFTASGDASKQTAATTTDGPPKAPKDDGPSLVGAALHYVKDKFFGKDDSSVQPCKNSINCLLQYSSKESQEHNAKYTHPCRFSEICRSKSDHPHLEHIPHPVPMCQYDGKCRKLGDPIHRSKYRHTDLPDFLVPCWKQKDCQDRTYEHKKKYFHGEDVSVSKASARSEHNARSSSKEDQRRQPRRHD